MTNNPKTISTSSAPSFLDLLENGFSKLPHSVIEKIDWFRNILVEENKKQNLTRILAPNDFIEGHIRDCFELCSVKFLDYPALDLGSGGGIPGIVCGILDNQRWFLTESEGKKAEFLKTTVKKLQLTQIKVYSGRAEKFLAETKPIGSVVVRAVAPITKIYHWIRPCSTWNNLILLKGRGWKEEWNHFQKTSHKKELKILHIHEYSIGPEKKQRLIIKLARNTPTH